MQTERKEELNVNGCVVRPTVVPRFHEPFLFTAMMKLRVLAQQSERDHPSLMNRNSVSSCVEGSTRSFTWIDYDRLVHLSTTQLCVSIPLTRASKGWSSDRVCCNEGRHHSILITERYPVEDIIVVHLLRQKMKIQEKREDSLHQHSFGNRHVENRSILSQESGEVVVQVHFLQKATNQLNNNGVEEEEICRWFCFRFESQALYFLKALRTHPLFVGNYVVKHFEPSAGGETGINTLLEALLLHKPSSSAARTSLHASPSPPFNCEADDDLPGDLFLGSGNADISPVEKCIIGKQSASDATESSRATPTCGTVSGAADGGMTASVGKRTKKVRGGSAVVGNSPVRATEKSPARLARYRKSKLQRIADMRSNESQDRSGRSRRYAISLMDTNSMTNNDHHTPREIGGCMRRDSSWGVTPRSSFHTKQGSQNNSPRPRSSDGLSVASVSSHATTAAGDCGSSAVALGHISTEAARVVREIQQADDVTLAPDGAERERASDSSDPHFLHLVEAPSSTRSSPSSRALLLTEKADAEGEGGKRVSCLQVSNSFSHPPKEGRGVSGYQGMDDSSNVATPRKKIRSGSFMDTRFQADDDGPAHSAIPELCPKLEEGKSVELSLPFYHGCGDGGWISGGLTRSILFAQLEEQHARIVALKEVLMDEPNSK